MTSSEWELGFLGDENKTPPRNLGQFNPLSLVTGGTNDLQRNVQSITKDVEMYAYAQLGLQTVAAVATFGFFLITLYTFLKKRKAGTY